MARKKVKRTHPATKFGRRNVFERILGETVRSTKKGIRASRNAAGKAYRKSMRAL